MSKPNKHTLSIMLLIAVSALWSTGGTLIKLISWNAFAVSGFRGLVAALTLLLLTRKFTFKLTIRQWFAALAYALTMMLVVLANKNTTAANAVFLNYTSPVYTAIGAHFLLKERIRRTDVISVAIIIIGMFFFVANGLSIGNFFGDAMALVSGISFAAMLLLFQSEKNNNPILCVIWGNLIAFAVSMPFIDSPEMSAQNVVLIIVTGVFQLGLSYFLYIRALKNVSALEGNIITVLEPILSPVWAFIFVDGELPSAMSVFGGVIIVAGLLFKEISQKRKTQ